MRSWGMRVGLMDGLSGAFVMWAFQSGTQEPLLAHCLELVRTTMLLTLPRLEPCRRH